VSRRLAREAAVSQHAGHGDGVRDLVPGNHFPDLELPDSDGHLRRLSELAGPDPLLLHTYRGWFCPKERAFFRGLIALQEDAEVAYARFVSISVDPVATTAAFRAGMGARWTFLCDEQRTALQETGLQELTDSVHDPFLPTVWLLFPDLSVHQWWMGYWYWGRPSGHELHLGLRQMSAMLRPDWDPPRPKGDR
jgi:peroxiredoxin